MVDPLAEGMAGAAAVANSRKRAQVSRRRMVAGMPPPVGLPWRQSLACFQAGAC